MATRWLLFSIFAIERWILTLCRSWLSVDEAESENDALSRQDLGARTAPTISVVVFVMTSRYGKKGIIGIHHIQR